MLRAGQNVPERYAASGASRRCRLAGWGLTTRQRWGAERAIEMSLTSKREEQEWMGIYCISQQPGGRL